MTKEKSKKVNKFEVDRIYLYIVGILLVSCFGFWIFNVCKPRPSEYYISYGNSTERAKVEKVFLTEKQIKKKYKNYEYVKVDTVKNVREVEFDELLKDESIRKYGIIFYDDLVLLPEEIFVNRIIDYSDKEFQFSKLESYIKIKEIEVDLEEIMNLTKVTIFETDSRMLENGKFIELVENTGVKTKDIEYLKANFSDIINGAGNRLLAMNKKSGQFVYGYRVNTTKKIDSYNILRHSGSVWSLILYYKYNPSEETKEIIERALDYLVENYVIKYTDDIVFVDEIKANEIKLGGNALALLALAEYKEVFDSDRYDEISRKIANGILYMQVKDGSFNHVLYENFKPKEKVRTVYFDGEAMFALLKYYKLTGDEKILTKVSKAMNYFIDHDYEVYRDHWMSYAINQLIKEEYNEKYVKFAFLNYNYSRVSMDSSKTFGPIRLELLMSTLDTYNYVKEHYPDSEEVKAFNISDLEHTIEVNLRVLLNYYIGPESAMYMKNPGKVIYGFSNYNSNFQMRIDDIQHSIAALMRYEEIVLNK